MRQGSIGIAALSLAVLSACSMAPDDRADGGLTVGENDRLEAAAARIDQRTPSPARGESERLEADVRGRLAQGDGTAQH